MNLVMAEKDQPVFRDFLGLGRIDDINQVKYLSSDVIPAPRTSPGFESECDGETNNTRASSGISGRFKTSSSPIHVTPPFYSAIPSSSDPGSVGWQRAQAAPLQYHGNKSAFSKLEADTNKLSRKRDSPTNRDSSLQERLVEALESTRPQKVSRHDHVRQEKIVETCEPSTDDLRLSMQPPRASSRSPPWLQQNTKPEAPQRQAKKQQPYRPSQISTGVGMRGISHLGACAERAEKIERTLAMPSRENNATGNPQLDRPAADEGSRTGLKGSLLAGLLDNAGLLHDRTTPNPAGSSGCPPLTPQHQKAPNQNGGSEPILPSSRQAPATSSRQLTIFYGGQAHVFDDVPSDKADAILTLAGSNGRSWSTTYSPRPAAKPTNSVSEGSMSAVEREKENSVQSLGGSLTLSSEVQTLLRGLKQSGPLTGRSV